MIRWINAAINCINHCGYNCDTNYSQSFWNGNVEQSESRPGRKMKQLVDYIEQLPKYAKRLSTTPAVAYDTFCSLKSYHRYVSVFSLSTGFCSSRRNLRCVSNRWTKWAEICKRYETNCVVSNRFIKFTGVFTLPTTSSSVMTLKNNYTVRVQSQWLNPVWK